MENVTTATNKDDEMVVRIICGLLIAGLTIGWIVEVVEYKTVNIGCLIMFFLSAIFSAIIFGTFK